MTCRFCRKQIADRRVRYFAWDFHFGCFEKLRLVAQRTGALL